MKVSTKSWHYWLNKKMKSEVFYEETVTLCTYFWATVWSVLKVFGNFVWVVAIVLGLLLTGVIIANILTFLSTAITGICFGWVDYNGAFGITIIICGMSLIVGGMLCINNHIDFAPEYIKKHFRKTKTTILKESKPSLVVEMYKAHKSKWCPLIEIED